MKLTLGADNLLEAAVLQAGVIPQAALLPVLSMGLSQAAIAAIRLNVFEHLHQQTMTVAELAAAINADEFGVQVLLESLEGFGLVQRQHERYQLTQDAIQYFTDAGDRSRKNFVYFFLSDVSRNLAQLEDKIRTGKQSNFHFAPPSSDCWANYLSFLETYPQRSLPKLMKWAKFARPPQRLLDVAGGPAQYSIAFCQKYPNLQADILELPQTVEYGTTVVEKVGLSDRIQYITENLLEDEWGSNYNVVLLFNILHNLSAEQCQVAIHKAFQALRPDGTLLSQEPFHPGNTRKLTAFEGFISLVYFAMSGARTWSKSTLQQWLNQASFIKLRFSQRQMVLLIAATKP
ncbi:methyltransferase family protein [Gloeocapsopsis dulcis]|uniref:Methyltransferase type 12 n=1 Tax=Gloeocapsopsis dulcis AAB1 = 1H9 TaxID=1433147 RepID=A0A6N8G1W6_9CHRO|nr:methyltransferase [Gloeocapsopsis dulcis]MUL39089.1 methyltransferase type 12 [Gloeocapsopsis dulcis AAB1 = 1H9]WNN92271.1 methyltransferase [Gloeocapsopsis dulcis]